MARQPCAAAALLLMAFHLSCASGSVTSRVLLQADDAPSAVASSPAPSPPYVSPADPDMWTVFGTNNFTYYLSTLEFRNARETCLSAGGDLVSFADSDEYTIVANALITGTDPYPAPVWIGVAGPSHESLYSLDPLYLDGSTSTFTYWGTDKYGHPNSGPASTEGSCVAIAPTWFNSEDLQVWNSYQCTDKNRFVCKVPVDNDYTEPMYPPTPAVPAQPSPAQPAEPSPVVSPSPAVPPSPLSPPAVPPSTMSPPASPDYIPHAFGVRIITEPSNPTTCTMMEVAVMTTILKYELASRLAGGKPTNCVELGDHAIVDIDMDSKESANIFMTVLKAGGMGMIVETAADGVPCNATISALPVSSLDEWVTFTCSGQSDHIYMREELALPQLCCSAEESSEESSTEESSSEESSSAEESSGSEESSTPEESSSTEGSSSEESSGTESSTEESTPEESSKPDESSSTEESSKAEESSSSEESSSGTLPMTPGEVSILLDAYNGCEVTLAVVNDLLMIRGVPAPSHKQCEVMFSAIGYLNVTLSFEDQSVVTSVIELMEQGDLAYAMHTAAGAPCGTLVWASPHPEIINAYDGIGCLAEANSTSYPITPTDTNTFVDQPDMCCGLSTPVPPGPGAPPPIPTTTTYWAATIVTDYDCEASTVLFRDFITKLGYNDSVVQPQEDSGTEIYITNGVYCQPGADQAVELGVLVTDGAVANALTALMSQGAAATLAHDMKSPCSALTKVSVQGSLGMSPPPTPPAPIFMGCVPANAANATLVLVPTMCCPGKNGDAVAALTVVTTGGSCTTAIRALYDLVDALDMRGSLQRVYMRSSTPPYSVVTQAGDVVCKSLASWAGAPQQVVLKAGFDCWFSAQEVVNGLQSDSGTPPGSLQSSFITTLGPQCGSVLQVRVAYVGPVKEPQDTLLSCLGPDGPDDPFFPYDELYDEPPPAMLAPGPTPSPSLGFNTTVVAVWAAPSICCASPPPPPGAPPSVPPQAPRPSPPSITTGSTLVIALKFKLSDAPTFRCDALRRSLMMAMSLLGLTDGQMPNGWMCIETSVITRLVLINFPEDATAGAIVDAVSKLPGVADGLITATGATCGTQFWMAAFPGLLGIQMNNGPATAAHVSGAALANPINPVIKLAAQSETDLLVRYSRTFMLPLDLFQNRTNLVFGCGQDVASQDVAAIAAASGAMVLGMPDLCCSSTPGVPSVPSISSPPRSMASSISSSTCQQYAAYYQWFAFYTMKPASWVCEKSNGVWMKADCGCPAPYTTSEGYMCCKAQAQMMGDKPGGRRLLLGRGAA